MLIVFTLIIIAVLIGLAYADYCLIDNTAHFGMTFERVAEIERARAEREAALEVAGYGAEVLGEGDADDSDVVVPPAVDVPGIAAREADRLGCPVPGVPAHGDCRDDG